jgi:phosphate:Na+ symporter
MPLSLFEGALGGIGLFLFGMRIMSDGIRTVADDRIRSVFAAVTSNRLYSLLFGMVLSLSLNSASAAVIFSIGLVNGGVLNVFQALSVLGGVLIGASLALYLPVIPYSLLATPFIFVGVLLKFFARRRRYANAGDLLLGAGLLFLGLSLLESSFRPSDNHPFYGAFNGAFFHSPLPAMLFGGMISWFVQSSLSLTTVIATLVASHHVTTLVAGDMVLGGLVGVAAIGGLVSIGGTSVSRRIAAAFFLINLVVVLLLIAFSPALVDLLHSDDLSGITGGGPLFAYLARVHTIAGLLTAVSATVLSSLVSRIIGAADDHGGNGAIPQPCAGYLDDRILNTPTLAIEQARKEIVRMMSVATFMFADTREILFDYDARRAETIRQHEQVLDSLNFEITSFLAKLAHSTINSEISFEIPVLLQTVTDLEHIGDRCEEILECIVARKEGAIIFSDDAMDDLKRLTVVVGSCLSSVEELFRNGTQPNSAELHEIKTVARMTFDEVKRTHFERISSGTCPPRAAMMFIELNAAFVRIAELCWNIMSVQGRKSV